MVFLRRPYFWGPRAIENHASNKTLGMSLLPENRMEQIIDLLDKPRVYRSILNFPLRRRLEVCVILFSSCCLLLVFRYVFMWSCRGQESIITALYGLPGCSLDVQIILLRYSLVIKCAMPISSRLVKTVMTQSFFCRSSITCLNQVRSILFFPERYLRNLVSSFLIGR